MCRLFCTVLTAEKKIETFSIAHYEIHLGDPEPLVTLVQQMRAFKQTSHSVVTIRQLITEPHPDFSRRIQ